MIVTKDELITQQQIELEELNETLVDRNEGMQKIRSVIFCIGGPLNDNCNKYTDKQLVPFARIINITEEHGE